MSEVQLSVNPRSELNLAVFGDVHGHLRLMLSLCRSWQKEHRKPLDAVLICGDLGCFFADSQLDRATRRYGERDPEELGFAQFFGLPEPLTRDPWVEKILLGPPDDLQTVSCPIIFCHGNHEDHCALRRLAETKPLAPVDYLGRIFYLRSGCLVDIGGLRVVAIGGGPEQPGAPPAEIVDKWVSLEAVWSALSHSQVDVLLTHAPPAADNFAYPFGSALIHEVIQLLQPYYHFYGHIRKEQPPKQFGRSMSYWLQNVCFRAGGSKPLRVADKCMGILSWKSEKEHTFRYVDEPWFARVHSANWWPRRR